MSIDEHQEDKLSDRHRRFTIAFFGRRCRLSLIPLERLVSSGITVATILIPASNELGPPVRALSTRPTIALGRERPRDPLRPLDQVAIQHEIPMFGIRRPLAAELETTLAELNPDLIVVSCFPWRIPKMIWRIAKHGAINLHPSLLPEYRGPDPLFWAYHDGAKEWGVTVHQVTEVLDGGPILSQRRFDIPDAISGDELETIAATHGAKLLLDAVNSIQSGISSVIEQDTSRSTYLPFPDDLDLTVQRTWTVRRTLNFISGVRPLGYAPLIETTRGTSVITQSAPSGDVVQLEDEVWLNKDLVRIRLADGVVDFGVRVG